MKTFVKTKISSCLFKYPKNWRATGPPSPPFFTKSFDQNYRKAI